MLVPSAILMFLLSLCLAGDPEDARDPRNLYVVGLFPTSGTIGAEGRASLAAANMALEQINYRSDVLPGYQLNMLYEDTKCDEGRALNVLFDLLYALPTKLFIIGPACSEATIYTNLGSQEWNITMVSYAAQSEVLSDKRKYHNFFRTSGTSIMRNPAHIELMSLYNWTQVAILQEAAEIFTEQTNHMTKLMEDEGFKLISNEIFQTDASVQIANLKKLDARIIFASVSPERMSELFCKVFGEGLYGDHIQWILDSYQASTGDKLWQSARGCTPQQFLQALNGAIYTGLSHINPVNQTSIGGITPSEFSKELSRILSSEQQQRHQSGLGFGPAAYDAMWAVALTLNDTIHRMKQQGINKTLDQFSYSDTDIYNLINKSVSGLEFVGVSGVVAFDETGNTPGIINIHQQIGESKMPVGYFTPDSARKKGNMTWYENGFQWRGGSPPVAVVTIMIKPIFVSQTLFTAMSAWAVVGMALDLILLVFCVTFRNRNAIKMSSPAMNYVVLVGCLLCYTNIFFADTKESVQSNILVCTIRLCTFIFGFSVVYGALFAKTWNVYFVFRNVRKSQEVVEELIGDKLLLMIPLGLALINVIIIGTWQIMDEFTLETKDLQSSASDEDENIMVVPRIEVCTSVYRVYFTGALYVVQGLVLIFGPFLAWETRAIVLETMNDSKEVGVCIYNIVLLSILGTVVSFTIQDDVNMMYGFTSAVLNTGTMATSLILFMPKIIRIAKAGCGLKETESIRDGQNFVSNVSTLTSKQSGDSCVATTPKQGGGHI